MRSSLVRHRGWTIAVVVCLGTALSVAACAMLRRWENSVLRANFALQAADRAAFFENRLRRDLAATSSLRSLYYSQGRMDEEGFHWHVGGWLERLPEIEAIEWIPVVPESEWAAFQRTGQLERITDAATKSPPGTPLGVPGRSDHYPVLYAEPSEKVKEVLGKDMANVPVLAEAIERARSTGVAVTTGPTKLAHRDGVQYAFQVVLPVYRKGAPTATVEDRRHGLVALTTVVFRIGDVLESAVTVTRPMGSDIFLYDVTAKSDSHLLAVHTSRTRTSPDLPAEDPREAAPRGIRWTHDVDVAGHRCRVAFVPMPQYFARQHAWRAWAALGFGLLATAFMAAFLAVLLGHTSRIQGLNEGLGRANEALRVEVVERKRAEEERLNVIHDLQDALSKVRQLSGLLPICASCKKIRDDKGYWHQVDVYIRDHSEAKLSHGICPDCMQKLYPEIVRDGPGSH